MSRVPSELLNTVTVSDVLAGLARVPTGSIHCAVTSPPYWRLRDYGTARWDGGSVSCDHVERMARKDAKRQTPGGRGGSFADTPIQFSEVCGKCGAHRIDDQIGIEEDMDEYLRRLVVVFREVRRVLRPDGTFWLNIGDSTAGGRAGRTDEEEASLRARHDGTSTRPKAGRAGGAGSRRAVPRGLKQKDLCMIPARLAIALQADGWWLRSEIVWCLSGGTYVYARTPRRGVCVVLVKDLARYDGALELWNGSRWTRMLGVSPSRKDGREIEITLRSGERIQCSATHMFPTSRGLAAASDLVVGDVLVRCRLPEPDAPKDCAIDEDAAWFAGLYLAEGSRSDDTIQLAGHAREEDRWTRVQRVAAKYGGSTTRTVSGNRMDIRVHGRMLVAILEELVRGRVARDKGFGSAVWRYSDRFVDAMLRGYLEGDGHWDAKNQRWRLGFTRNYNLERDLRVACARLGYRLRLTMAFAKYQNGRRQIFRGEIRTTAHVGHWNERDYAEVVCIRPARVRSLYDIGVADEPHIFAIASGILTHNSKANPLPEPVTSRPSRAHEMVYLLSPSSEYFYDSVAVRGPVSGGAHHRGNGVHPKAAAAPDGTRANGSFCAAVRELVDDRNLRDVWTLATEQTPYEHFACYPERLVEPCVLAGTSEHGACAECGAPWSRVTERRRGRSSERASRDATAAVTRGWEPGCSCNAPVVPCVVLDPFAGTATTGVVARRFGRDFVGFDLNPAYASIGRGRLGALPADAPVVNRELPLFAAARRRAP